MSKTTLRALGCLPDNFPEVAKLKVLKFISSCSGSRFKKTLLPFIQEESEASYERKGQSFRTHASAIDAIVHFFLILSGALQRRKMATATPQGLLIYHAVPTQSTAGLGLGQAVVNLEQDPRRGGAGEFVKSFSLFLFFQTLLLQVMCSVICFHFTG